MPKKILLWLGCLKLIIFCFYLQSLNAVSKIEENTGFFVGTPIMVEPGVFKPIEEIQEEEYIWSLSFRHKYHKSSKVTKVEKYLTNQVVRIVFQDDSVFEVPSKQQLYLPAETSFAPANFFVPDMPIKTFYTHVAIIKSVTNIELDYPKVAIALTIQDTQNFFVGEKGFLAHNNPAIAEVITTTIESDSFLLFSETCESILFANPEVAGVVFGIGVLAYLGYCNYPRVLNYFQPSQVQFDETLKLPSKEVESEKVHAVPDSIETFKKLKQVKSVIYNDFMKADEVVDKYCEAVKMAQPQDFCTIQSPDQYRYAINNSSNNNSYLSLHVGNSVSTSHCSIPFEFSNARQSKAKPLDKELLKEICILKILLNAIKTLATEKIPVTHDFFDFVGYLKQNADELLDKYLKDVIPVQQGIADKLLSYFVSGLLQEKQEIINEIKMRCLNEPAVIPMVCKNPKKYFIKTYFKDTYGSHIVPIKTKSEDPSFLWHVFSPKGNRLFFIDADGKPSWLRPELDPGPYKDVVNLEKLNFASVSAPPIEIGSCTQHPATVVTDQENNRWIYWAHGNVWSIYSPDNELIDRIDLENKSTLLEIDWVTGINFLANVFEDYPDIKKSILSLHLDSMMPLCIIPNFQDQPCVKLNGFEQVVSLKFAEQALASMILTLDYALDFIEKEIAKNNKNKGIKKKGSNPAVLIPAPTPPPPPPPPDPLKELLKKIKEKMQNIFNYIKNNKIRTATYVGITGLLLEKFIGPNKKSYIVDLLGSLGMYECITDPAAKEGIMLSIICVALLLDRFYERYKAGSEETSVSIDNKDYQMLRKELELLKHSAKQAEVIHQQDLELVGVYKKMLEQAKDQLEQGKIIHQQDLELIRIQGLLIGELMAKYVQFKTIPSVDAEIVLSKLSNNSEKNVSLFDYLFREGKALAA